MPHTLRLSPWDEVWLVRAVFIRICLAIALLIFALLVYAFAAEADVVATDSQWHDVWLYLQPAASVILTFMAPVVGAYAVLILVRLFALVGVQLDQRTVEALHRAAVNGLKQAATKYAGPVPDLTRYVPPEILSEAERYVNELNPSAAAKAPEGAIRDIILSKAPDVQAILTAASGGTTPSTPLTQAAPPA